MTSIAGLDGDQRNRIAGLLGRSVVRISAGRDTGTGFFISPKEVLTCRHVVSGAIGPRAAPISVQWFPTGSGTPVTLTATVLEVPSGDWPDIAILSITDGASDCCVILDADQVVDGTPLMTGGYPAKALIPFQTHRFTAGFPGHGEGEVRELRIEGDMVTGGMSGSPIVSAQSGLVIGVLRISKGDNSRLGGFGTMFADVTAKLRGLQPLVDRPAAAAGQWLRTVGATNLKEAGRDWKTGARWSQTSVLPRIDLTVKQDADGAAGTWHIGVRNIRASGDTDTWVQRSAADLGDGVVRAVDGWSRRQMITRPEEVEILGRVLDRALLPGEARTAVDDDLTVPPFLLRVCVDRAGGLSQLPWEYACGDDAVPLSVNENLAFARFVDAPGTPPPPRDRLRVLGVIEIPEFESAEFRDYQDESRRTIRPSGREFARILSETFAGNKRIEFVPAVNMAGPELQEKLADGWDVVHYLGFAWATAREIVISVGCGKRSTFNPISIDQLRKDYLALSQCSVFVAEFHRPPLGPDLGPPADPGAFTGLLRDYLHAVVVTQHPVDLVDFQKFNDSFYQQITKGEIVELAAQAGRCAVRGSIRPDPDATAFGSFTLTTRRAGEVRLLKPPLVTGGAAQTGPPEAASGLAATGQGLDTVVSGQW
jgi:Trypsin-like peptidase domain